MTAGPFIDDAHQEYINSIGISSKRLYDILLRELAKHTTQGNLEANKLQLAQLDSILKQALKDSGYSSATDKYFTTFDKLEEHNEKYYGTQNLALSPVLKESQIIPHIKDKVLSNLRGTGVSESILKPLENLMRQEIFLNKSYQETSDLLKKQLVDNSLLVKHVDQVAFDALRQYNGAINDEVRKTYGLKYFFYVGSEIETTRPICDHIRDNYKGAISIDDLQIILDEFCPNGEPSNTSITYETVNGVKHTSKKGAGMYDGTTVDNFSMNCGGYRCRHEVKWVRNPKQVGKIGDKNTAPKNIKDKIDDISKLQEKPKSNKLPVLSAATPELILVKGIADISTFFTKYIQNKISKQQIRQNLKEITELPEYSQVNMPKKYSGKLYELKNIKKDEADLKNERAVIPVLKKGYDVYMLPKSKEYGIKSADVILAKENKYLLSEIKVITGKNTLDINRNFNDAAIKSNTVFLSFESTAFSGRIILDNIRGRINNYENVEFVIVTIYGVPYIMKANQIKSKEYTNLELYKIK